ncbi:MAG: S9 family peptidase [Acidobacteria bacterium]|nr:S9 family peptidase [Acidobacteriota bacterium]
MRSALSYFLLLPVFSSLLVASSGPDNRAVTDPKTLSSQSNPAAKPVPIEDLFMTRTVNAGGWSPDGQQIVFESNASGRTNIWKMHADGAAATQLTHSDDRQFAPVWSPDGKWIVYQQDVGGAEIWDLFAVPSEGGEPVNLTNTEKIAESSPLWSPDGSRIAIAYKPKESPITDIALLDWKKREVKKLTNEQEQDHRWTAAAWSRDGKLLLASRSNALFSDGDVYLIDTTTGNSRNLTAHSGQQLFTAHDLSPDGKLALISSNAQGGFFNVALLDVSNRKLRWVTDTQWDGQARAFSPNGKQFTYILNEDGRTRAFIGDVAGGTSIQLKMPEGVNGLADDPTPFSPDGSKLLMTHQSSRRPNDLWSYTIATGAAQQLTKSANPSVDASLLPQSQLVTYKSFDGTMISAFVWLPFNLKRDGSNPAIVLPHGGPTGQTPDTFSRTAAALATRGYICIAPNVRGSTGYGKKFQEMNIKDLGGGDLQDEVYAVKFLEASGYVDAKRVGITGGSYGGYMTLMAVGKTPDVWSAAVEQYGIINWLTMLQHEDAFLQQYEKSLLGDPEKDRKIYEDDSPLKYIRNEKAPLLVLQGENDPRVPKEEAEQVVEILKQEGRTVDVHYYPKEGHGFAKREDQIDALTRTTAWFDRYLKGSSAGAASHSSAAETTK